MSNGSSSDEGNSRPGHGTPLPQPEGGSVHPPEPLTIGIAAAVGGLIGGLVGALIGSGMV